MHLQRVPNFYKMCQQRRKSKYENIVFAVLLLAGFSFAVGRFTSTVKLIKNFVYYFSYSNLSLASYVFHSAGNLTDDIKGLFCLRQENIAYKQKNRELADKLRNYEAVLEEYDNLSKLLKLAKMKNTVSVFARISIRDPSKWHKWFIIDKGGKDGLYNELPVMMFNRKKDALCAVGKIVETHRSSSKVALITNAVCALPVEIKGKGVNCLAEGFNSNLLRITYIPRDAAVEAGDEVVASELSSVFQKGTPVGVITDVLEEPCIDFKTATAKVFFEIDSVYEAVILVPQAPHVRRPPKETAESKAPGPEDGKTNKMPPAAENTELGSQRPAGETGKANRIPKITENISLETERPAAFPVQQKRARTENITLETERPIAER